MSNKDSLNNANPSIFQLKGTMLAITVFELTQFDAALLKEQLIQKVNEAPEFFETIPMVLSVDKLNTPLDKAELKATINLFKQYNIQLMAIRTDDEKTIAMAGKMGLIVLPPTGAREKLIEIAVNRPTPIIPTIDEVVPETLPIIEKTTETTDVIEATDQSLDQPLDKSEINDADEKQQQLAIDEPTSETIDSKTIENLETTEQEADIQADTPETHEGTDLKAAITVPKNKHQIQPTKIVTTAVRSGQQIEAEDSDLVVTSNISMGAELIADGNIHIYGSMRGRAMAGYRGNNKACVFCHKLTAELISIAGQIITEEDLRRHPLWGKPAQLSLKDNQLIITPL